MDDPLRHCRRRKLPETICADARRIQLIGDRGTVFPVHIERCWAGGMVEIEWTSDAPLGARGHVAITLARTDDEFVPFRITGIHPFVYEWPLTSGEPGANLRVQIPVFGTCRGIDEAETVEFPLPALDRDSCWFPDWFSGDDPNWCNVRLEPGERRYVIRDYRLGVPRRFRQSAEISQRGEDIALVLGPRRRALADDQRGELAARLDALWVMTPNITESCRDGFLTFFGLVSEDRWKAVLRSCSDPVGVRYLFPKKGRR